MLVRVWRKGNPLTLLVGMQAGTATMENSVGIPYKTGNRTAAWPRMMVTTILYARQQKRHRCKKEATELCGRRRGWDDMREQHWNMYNTICITDDQFKFDAWSRALKAGALGQPRGMGWEGKWEGDSGLGGSHVHPWLIGVDVWHGPPQCCEVIVLQLK